VGMLFFFNFIPTAIQVPTAKNYQQSKSVLPHQNMSFTQQPTTHTQFVSLKIQHKHQVRIDELLKITASDFLLHPILTYIFHLP
jgi:hypothetical protein